MFETFARFDNDLPDDKRLKKHEADGGSARCARATTASIKLARWRCVERCYHVTTTLISNVVLR